MWNDHNYDNDDHNIVDDDDDYHAHDNYNVYHDNDNDNDNVGRALARKL